MEVPTHLSKAPQIAETSWVAPGAVLVGDVTIGDYASVWYQSVLRADINRIIIGPRSNVQDGSVVHLARDYGCYVGESTTIGHKAVLHACTIADEVLVGMGAIILDGVEIGPRCIIGAGALITGHKKIPEGSLVLGSPAKVVRTLSLEEQRELRGWADNYVKLIPAYKAGLAKTVVPS